MDLQTNCLWHFETRDSNTSEMGRGTLLYLGLAQITQSTGLNRERAGCFC